MSVMLYSCMFCVAPLMDLFVWYVACLTVLVNVWYDLLMTSAICCPMWSTVYECHKVECEFILYLCQLFCSAWMCCLEEVYICLQL